MPYPGFLLIVCTKVELPVSFKKLGPTAEFSKNRVSYGLPPGFKF